MNPPAPPPATPPLPSETPASPRVARATIVLVAVGLVLVAALAVGLVSVGRWSYSALRMQARTSPDDTAAATPPVVGPARPAAPASPAPSAAAPPRRADEAAAPSPGVSADGRASGAEAAAGMASLRMPVDGVAPSDLYPSFDEARGTRRHEAIDIMAPRGTPVRAAVDGRVVKLFASDAGGLTVYQFDRAERLAYYYAHLDRYAAGLREGTELAQGDVLGYVGSTGNASADAPHLHFAVFELGPEKRWWEGRAIDPYPLLGGS